MSLEDEFRIYSRVEAFGKHLELEGHVLKRLPAHERLRQLVFDRKPVDIDLCTAFAECLNEALDLVVSQQNTESQVLDLREANLELREQLLNQKEGDRHDH